MKRAALVLAIALASGGACGSDSKTGDAAAGGASGGAGAGGSADGGSSGGGGSSGSAGGASGSGGSSSGGAGTGGATAGSGGRGGGAAGSGGGGGGAAGAPGGAGRGGSVGPGGSGGSAGTAGTGQAGRGGQGGAACQAIGQACSASMACCPPMVCLGTCQQNPSDRELKTGFTAIDRDVVLDRLARLPLHNWTDAGGVRHIGPRPHEFRAMFDVGTDDRTILQVDADGVTLGALQAIDARLAHVRADSAALRRELDALRSDLRRRR